MESSHQRRDAQVLWNHSRNGPGANAEIEVLLGQWSDVCVSEIIRNVMSRERDLSYSSDFGIFRTTITKTRTTRGCSS